MSEHLLRQIPQVSRVIEHPSLQVMRALLPQCDVTDAIRVELEVLRTGLLNNTLHEDDLNVANIAERVVSRLDRSLTPNFRPVINATGIVLHTNLGRSPLADTAARAAWEAGRGYLNLELDLDTGERSNRQNPIREGVQRITGAESATVVNNCAAATVIVLRTLAAGKEVIVSRGQLIEIGGSFRIPEIMAVSGATLREVGATNRTRLADYESAIGPNTGLLMRVHTSNYRIRGFTETVGIRELAALGKKHNIPVVDDVGSGVAIDLTPFGLPGEPVISEGIAAGADLVLFSGDKLLGGPQAGIIAGKKQYIQAIERDPLMRALRLDKMSLAALEATLRLYRDPVKACELIPTLQMLTMPLATLAERTEKFAQRLNSVPGLESLAILDDVAFVGGGSLPDVSLPTKVIAIRVKGMSEETFAHRLRIGKIAVVARIQNGHCQFDLRTVFPRQEDDLIAAIRAASSGEVL